MQITHEPSAPKVDGAGEATKVFGFRRYAGVRQSDRFSEVPIARWLGVRCIGDRTEGGEQLESKVESGVLQASAELEAAPEDSDGGMTHSRLTVTTPEVLVSSSTCEALEYMSVCPSAVDPFFCSCAFSRGCAPHAQPRATSTPIANDRTGAQDCALRGSMLPSVRACTHSAWLPRLAQSCAVVPTLSTSSVRAPARRNRRTMVSCPSAAAPAKAVVPCLF